MKFSRSYFCFSRDAIRSKILVEQPLHILAVVAIIMIGKTLAAMALVLFFRYPINTALTVGASLAQIGEFSFILATLGLSRLTHSRCTESDFLQVHYFQLH